MLGLSVYFSHIQAACNANFFAPGYSHSHIQVHTQEFCKTIEVSQDMSCSRSNALQPSFGCGCVPGYCDYLLLHNLKIFCSL